MNCLMICINKKCAKRCYHEVLFYSKRALKNLFFCQITSNIQVFFSVNSNSFVAIRIIDIWETVIPTYLNLAFFNFSAMFWGYEIWPGYLPKSMTEFHLFYLSCYHVMLKVSFVYYFLCFCVCKGKLCSYTRSTKVYKSDSWNSHIFTKTFCLKEKRE